MGSPTAGNCVQVPVSGPLAPDAAGDDDAFPADVAAEELPEDEGGCGVEEEVSSDVAAPLEGIASEVPAALLLDEAPGAEEGGDTLAELAGEEEGPLLLEREDVPTAYDEELAPTTPASSGCGGSVLAAGTQDAPSSATPKTSSRHPCMEHP
jgi:hypothetical protein